MASIGNDYFTSGPGLKQVAEHTISSQEPEVDIIIISSPWLVRANKWAICTSIEHDLLLGNAKIYAYEPISEISDSFTWDQLLGQGIALAKILDDRHKGKSLRPVVLMAHSLGGYILKKFLTVIHITSRELYKALRAAVAGVVFLGCPHASTANRRDILYKRSIAMLELSRALQKKHRAKLAQGDVLMNVCADVDGMSVHVKMLTLHEQRPTRITRSWRGNNLDLVVDKQLATVRGRTEMVTGIDAEHRDLPFFKDDHSESKLDDMTLKWIQHLIRRASNNPQCTRSIGARTPLSETLQFTSENDEASVLSFVPKVADNPQTECPRLEPLISIFTPSKPIPQTLPPLNMDIARERNPQFCGRAMILEELDTQLVTGSRMVVLCGPGGIGKTEVAIEYVHQHSDKFDVVFWLQADDLSKLRQDFGRFAAELGLDQGPSRTDPFMSRELVKTWLMAPLKPVALGKAHEEARWLIIFDNVNNRGVLGEFASLPGKGSILITSRELQAASAFDCNATRSTADYDAHHIYLEPFSKDVATHMLKSLAGVAISEETDVAQEIAEQLDGLPLAINEMGSTIRNQYLGLAEFKDQHILVPNDDGVPPSRPVATTDVSLSSIRMKLLSCSARALLRVCAMLDPDCIHEALFCSLSKAEVQLEGFPLCAPDFTRARSELLNASLIQRNKTKQQLWMHRLTQDAVRQECPTPLLGRVFRATTIIVKKAWQPPPNFVRDNLKIWEPCAAYLRHVVHLQGVYQDQLEQSGSQLQPCYSFAWLLNEVGCFQRSLGHTAGLKKTLDLALSVCSVLTSADSVNLLSDIYHGLGAWANETNKAQECMNYNTRYLRMRLDLDKAGGKPNERTAIAYNQYGTGLMMVRRYNEAVEAFETSIKTFKKCSAHAPCTDSLAVVNLALAKSMLNDLTGSAALLNEGRLAREEAFGFMDSNSFRTGRFFHALGNVSYEQKDLLTSRLWHVRALAQYTKSLGPRHHRTADVRHRVAMHCLREKDYGSAGKLIDQALDSWHMDAESFKPEIARTTWLKAKQREMAGSGLEAELLRVRAAAMRVELRPGDERSHDLLTDADFDDLVAFWSR